MHRTTISIVLSLPVLVLCHAQTPAGNDQTGYTDTPLIPGQKWRVHDATRPRPALVTPKQAVPSIPPPADADVLFNGKDFSQWTMKSRRGETAEPFWKIAPDGSYFEIVPPTGALAANPANPNAKTPMRWNLITKKGYGSVQLHVEWMVPMEVTTKGQAGGNSGIELMSRYEIQVLESHENLTYADGQAASIYGQWPPLVNASMPKGQWNSYDIFFEAPEFKGEALVKPAYATVVHNGVLVHHRREILGPAAHRRNAPYQAHAEREPLSIQDHGHPVRYRNLWIRSLE